jgi:hypothetical protein
VKKYNLNYDIIILGDENDKINSFPKVEIRNNGLNGKGIFANENINKGEVVFIKGGHILRKEQLYSSSIINSYFPIIQ